MRRSAALVFMVVWLLALVGCIGSSSHEVTVLVNLRGVEGDNYVWSKDAGCRGLGGYSDMSPGTDVTLRDGNGSIVGSGRLEVSGDGFPCRFESKFEIDDAKFYEIEIGHRGGPSFTKSQLEDDMWIISLTLGD